MIVDIDIGAKDDHESGRLVDYYFRACRWLHEGVFTFEYGYSIDFLRSFEYKDVKELTWVPLLTNAIDKTLFNEYEQQSSKYRKEESGATFLFCFYGYSGIGSRTITVSVEKDKDPSSILARFVNRFEYITGVRLGLERFLFVGPGRRPLTEESEITSQAIKSRVSVGIVPRQGHPHENPWSFEDVIPTIMMYVYRDGLCFPLETRFRIWTFIWGTAQTVTRLIKANPSLLEKAQSLGVDESVFNDVIESPIPSSPATELIPLETLESTTLLRGLIGHMHDRGMITDDTGLCLKMNMP